MCTGAVIVSVMLVTFDYPEFPVIIKNGYYFYDLHFNLELLHGVSQRTQRFTEVL